MPVNAQPHDPADLVLPPDPFEEEKRRFLERHPAWYILAAQNDPALHRYVRPDYLALADGGKQKVLETLNLDDFKSFDDIHHVIDDVNGMGEELLSYPGLTALVAHKLANASYLAGDSIHKARARRIAEHAHTLTGIDIHPGAQLNDYVFMDHGTGLIIGETARVGKGTRLYHSSTLGAYGKGITTDELGREIRHPSVGNFVIMSNTAQVLGDCRINDHVTLGPQSTVIKSDIQHDANIQPGALVMNAKVGVGAIVGPGVTWVGKDIPDYHTVNKVGDLVVVQPIAGSKADRQWLQLPKVVDLPSVRSLYESVLSPVVGSHLAH